MAKGLKSLISIEQIACLKFIRAMNQWRNRGLGRFMPSFLPYGKAGELQILRCQGFAVDLLRLHP